MHTSETNPSTITQAVDPFTATHLEDHQRLELERLAGSIHRLWRARVDDAAESVQADIDAVEASSYSSEISELVVSAKQLLDRQVHLCSNQVGVRDTHARVFSMLFAPPPTYVSVAE